MSDIIPPATNESGNITNSDPAPPVAAAEKSKPSVAYYHQEGKAPLALTVVTVNEDDGTVDLANADGDVIVRRCEVTDAPTPGKATLPPKEEGKKKKA